MTSLGCKVLCVELSSKFVWVIVHHQFQWHYVNPFSKKELLLKLGFVIWCWEETIQKNWSCACKHPRQEINCWSMEWVGGVMCLTSFMKNSILAQMVELMALFQILLKLNMKCSSKWSQYCYNYYYDD